MTPDSGPKVETIQTVSGKAQIREQDKIQLILSYLWFLCLVPFLTVKDSAFVQWHAKQGLTLSVVWVGLWVVDVVLSMILSSFALPFNCLFSLIGLALLVLDVVAMIKALGGERWEIPVIGQLAKKF